MSEKGKPSFARRLTDASKVVIKRGAQAVAGAVRTVGNSLDFADPSTAIRLPDDMSTSDKSMMTAQVCPPPTIDRYPVIIGTYINQAYASSVERNALQGYRQQQVDLYSELIDHEPAAQGMLAQRVLAVACSPVVLSPPEGLEGEELKRSQAYCVEILCELKAIPKWSQVKYRMIYQGLLFGIAGEEKIFTLDTATKKWRIVLSEQIHSRRLAYPIWNVWDLRIFDQGLGGGAGSNAATFGLPINALPDKFAIHSPTLRGEYPSREGLGRLLSTYMLLKRLVMRVSAQDYERFVKPWVVAYFNTDPSLAGKPRFATTADINAAKQAVNALGVGSLNSATLPDSIKIEMLSAVSKLTQHEFAGYLDSSMALLIRGQPFTSIAGKYGTKGGQEQGQEGEEKIAQNDADQFAETIQSDYVNVLMKLNHAEDMHLAPQVSIPTKKLPPLMAMQIGQLAVGMNAPVDGRKLCEENGVQLLSKDSGEDAIKLTLVAPTPAGAIEGNEHIDMSKVQKPATEDVKPPNGKPPVPEKG